MVLVCGKGVLCGVIFSYVFACCSLPVNLNFFFSLIAQATEPFLDFTELFVLFIELLVNFVMKQVMEILLPSLKR